MVAWPDVWSGLAGRATEPAQPVSRASTAAAAASWPLPRSPPRLRGATAPGLGAAHRQPGLHSALDGVDQGVGHPKHLPVAVQLQLLRLGVVICGVGVDLVNQVLVVHPEDVGEGLDGKLVADDVAKVQREPGPEAAQILRGGSLGGLTAAAAPTGTGMAGGVFLGQLYWANYGTGSINQANLDGSNPKAIVTGQDSPIGVAVDTTHLYWTNGVAGTIWRANLDGSRPQPLVTGQNRPFGVAVDATRLYWANSPVSADGSIWAANPDGSNPKALVTGQNNPLQVAVDPSHLYWTNQGDSTIWQANLDGTNPQAFATGQDDPWGVAVSPVVGVS